MPMPESWNEVSIVLKIADFIFLAHLAWIAGAKKAAKQVMLLELASPPAPQRRLVNLTTCTCVAADRVFFPTVTAIYNVVTAHTAAIRYKKPR
jgi:hypothetical protein